MIFRLDKIALRWMVVLAFACATGSAAVEADSAATSVTVDSAQKLSPFDHLGHNMLLSAFGWPLVPHARWSAYVQVLDGK